MQDTYIWRPPLRIGFPANATQPLTRQPDSEHPNRLPLCTGRHPLRTQGRTATGPPSEAAPLRRAPALWQLHRAAPPARHLPAVASVPRAAAGRQKKQGRVARGLQHTQDYWQAWWSRACTAAHPACRWLSDHGEPLLHLALICCRCCSARSVRENSSRLLKSVVKKPLPGCSQLGFGHHVQHALSIPHRARLAMR